MIAKNAAITIRRRSPHPPTEANLADPSRLCSIWVSTSVSKPAHGIGACHFGASHVLRWAHASPTFGPRQELLRLVCILQLPRPWRRREDRPSSASCSEPRADGAGTPLLNLDLVVSFSRSAMTNDALQVLRRASSGRTFLSGDGWPGGSSHLLAFLTLGGDRRGIVFLLPDPFLVAAREDR